MGISVIGGSTGGGGKFQKTEVIKSTQSWTAPADVSEVEVILCGGGGGGGWSNEDVYTGGGGGGSVDFAIFAVSPGSSYTITIGAGGAAPPTVGDFGAAGNASSFGALMSVNGGLGGGPSQGNLGRGAGRGGNGGQVSLLDSRSFLPTRGIGPYGEGGGARRRTAYYVGPQDGIANYGIGGHSANNTNATPSNGGSGVCIIKYWTAG